MNTDVQHGFSAIRPCDFDAERHQLPSRQRESTEPMAGEWSGPLRINGIQRCVDTPAQTVVRVGASKVSRRQSSSTAVGDHISVHATSKRARI